MPGCLPAVVEGIRAAALIPNQWKAIIKRRYRPQLIVCIMVPL